MEKHVEDEVVYYYDSHPTEEDLMGETSFHSNLVRYLTLVLRWLFQGQRCAIYENLNFYQTPDPNEYPLAPDLAVIKGVAFQEVRSWRVGRTGPAPQVVFEIMSTETWKKDLFEKPMKYAQMGVQEYFAYDPHVPPLARATARRLFGWRLDKETQVMRELPLEPDGRLWSIQLESFLIPDGKYLRLYDRHGQLRLTEAQAETRRAETAIRQAEIEAKRVRALAEKLRSLGIDPDQVV
jgi:Uma2 family endonuclease